MAKKNSYNPNIHTHAMVPALVNGPVEIVLHTGRYVWLTGACNWIDDSTPLFKRVGDGRSDGCDKATGACIISVPECYVTAYGTEEEAERINELMHIDSVMLQNAR